MALTIHPNLEPRLKRVELYLCSLSGPSRVNFFHIFTIYRCTRPLFETEVSSQLGSCSCIMLGK